MLIIYYYAVGTFNSKQHSTQGTHRQSKTTTESAFAGINPKRNTFFEAQL